MARHDADRAYHDAKMAHRELQQRIEDAHRQRERAWEARERLDRLLAPGAGRHTIPALRGEWLRFAEEGETFAALLLLDRLIAADADHRSELLPRRAEHLLAAQELRGDDPLLALALAQQAVLTPALGTDRRRLLPALGRAAEAFDTSLAYRLLGATRIAAGAPEAAVASPEEAVARRPSDAVPREELLLGLAYARLGRKVEARAQARIGRAWRDRPARRAQQADERDPLAALEMDLLQSRLEYMVEE